MAALDAIVQGEVDIVFRRWRKPTVKTGGTLRTPRGELDIVSVKAITRTQLSPADARRAGFSSKAELERWLFAPQKPANRGRVAKPDNTKIYRVEVAFRGEDPRVQLRASLLTETELTGVLTRVGKFDLRSAKGPWAVQAIHLIQQWPGRRAPELAELAGWETAAWKNNIRKLKELGLTESLPVGYQLSPRGEQVAAALQQPNSPHSADSPSD
jgi:hypothetical protein